MTGPEEENSQRWKVDQWLSGPGERGKGRVTAIGNVLELVMMVAQTCKYIKTTLSCTL